jgi:hypothetical protein
MLSLERSILTMQRANNPSSGSQLVAPMLIYNLYKGIKQNKTLWRSVAHYKGSQSTNLSMIVEYTEGAASVYIKLQESVEVTFGRCHSCTRRSRLCIGNIVRFSHPWPWKVRGSYRNNSLCDHLRHLVINCSYGAYRFPDLRNRWNSLLYVNILTSSSITTLIALSISLLHKVGVGWF